MLYILYGEDDFSLRRALEKIKRDIGDETALSTNTTVLEGPQVTVDQMRMAAETVPFLAKKRLVIVNGLLGRFEEKGRSDRRKKAGDKSELRNELQAFSDYLGKVPPTAVVVLVDGKIKGGNPLLGALKDGARVMSFATLRRGHLEEWIRKRVTEKGGVIAPPAVALLAGQVGGNLWVMAGEVDKLVAFCGGRTIGEADVRQVVSSFQEVSVFNLIDAICEFKVGRAERLLEELLQQGATAAYLLAMLTRQVRNMVLARELRRQRKSEPEMMRRLEMGDYALRRTLEQAGRYSVERLRKFYHRLLETDLAIKRGYYSADVALNILVAEVSQRQPA